MTDTSTVAPAAPPVAAAPDTSGVTGPCYTPEAFRPDDKPLLTVDQWRKIQMFLATAAALPLSKDKYPDERALPIFASIHGASLVFQTQVLPKAAALGGDLWNFAQSSIDTFKAIDNLINKAGEPDKTSIKSLYDELLSIATDQERESGEMAGDTRTFSRSLEAVEVPLAKLLKEIDVELGPLNVEVKALNEDVKAQNAIIQDAHDAILGDQKTIRETRYYAWIPIIGAIVAVAEIATHQQDIQNQMDLISKAATAVNADSQRLNVLNDKIGHLTMAHTLMDNMQKVIDELLPSIEKISGAWSGIKSELDQVLSNINKSEASELKQNRCLAEVSLTSAINEFMSVRNDAHDYLFNFHMEDAADKKLA